MEMMIAANELQKSDNRPYPKILHLEVGQPSNGPPEQALIEAFQQQVSSSSSSASPCKTPVSLGYTLSVGMPSLRESVARHYRQSYDNTGDITADDMVITTGASGALIALCAAAFDQTNRVAITVPGYPCHRHVLRAFDIGVITIPTGVDTNFQPSIEQLEQLPLAEKDGLILASPANPTGACLSEHLLERIVAFCRKRKVTLIVDEIYHGVTRGPIPSVLQFVTAAENNRSNNNNDENKNDVTEEPPIISVGSMSKYWCMTGFRIGWIVTRHRDLLSTVDKCLQSMAICAPTPGQHVANIVLSGRFDEYFTSHVKRYFKGIDALASRLRSAGFDLAKPVQGTFYIFAGCQAVCEMCNVECSKQLCKVLLYECGVACAPGDDFDETNGKWFIRFSCAGPLEDVTEAGDRIVQYMSSRQHPN